MREDGGKVELFIGGKAQGKLECVKGIYPNAQVLEAEEIVSLFLGETLPEEVAGNCKKTSEPAKPIERQEAKELQASAEQEEPKEMDELMAPEVWNHFHLVVRSLLAKGLGQEEIWEGFCKLREERSDLIVISDEIGNGIVPMEKEERIWREVTGRLLCRIAKEARTVTRVFCSIPVPIKWNDSEPC